MSEEIKKRGRQKGEVKPKGYIIINSDLRIRVEQDSLIWEERIGNKELSDEEALWGNNKYFTSWDGILNYLTRRITTDRISQKGVLTFKDGKEEILLAIEECKNILLGQINEQMHIANDEIKNAIIKFVR